MSTGGVFQLIANDGKADKMIMATDLLRQRIESVKCARRAARDRGLPGYDDDTPTLVDIERSHILYVNTHFKPFAAIGYEYQKVGPQVGTPGWGVQVQYSLPQFGDFFYDMVMQLQLTAASANAVDLTTALTNTPGQPGGPPVNTVTPAGNVVTIFHTRYLDATGAVVWDPNATLNDPTSTNVTVPLPTANYVRYAEFPAMRMAQEVQFTVNGNPLDLYTYNTYAFYNEFRIPPHKRVGWNRAVGQQVPILGTTDLTVTSASSRNVPAAPQEFIQTQVSVLAGLQTPQPTLPAAEFWLKLLLWFNEDVRLSIPSVSIPYGQRFINVTFAQQADVIFTASNGLVFESKTTTITFGNAPSPPAGGPVVNNYANAVSVAVYRDLVTIPGSVVQPVTFQATLYINNIFVNPEIHDIYIKRIGFNLIRVHRVQAVTCTTSAQEVLLSQLKWPIEYFYVGMRPVENTDPANNERWRSWHRFTQQVRRFSPLPTAVESTQLPQSFAGTSGLPGFYNPGTGAVTPSTFVTYYGEQNGVTWWDSNPTLATVAISAHQIPIYRDTSAAFYNEYLPLQYGGINITTPDDQGMLLINFCLYPGTYQPSGHFNVSRAREFYLAYTSTLISAQYPGNLILDASALNFLLIADGSAVLRYST